MNETTCRAIVLRRSGFGDAAMSRCERCGSSEQGSMQHIVKRSQGGGWTPSNIVRLCGDGTRGCHGWAEANPRDAQRDGFARESTGPVVPVLHAVLGPVWLDDEGGYHLHFPGRDVPGVDGSAERFRAVSEVQPRDDDPEP